MKKIKKYILLLICFIIIIIGLIVFLQKNKKNEQKNIIYDGDPGITIEVNNNIKKVDNYSTFKNVEQCIQQYYNILNNESSIFYGKDDDGNYIKIFSEDEINKIRLDLLSDEYVSKNNIRLDNIKNHITAYNEQYSVIALEMNQLLNTNTSKYIAKGIIINDKNQYVNEFYIIVNIDLYNKTFSIEPLSKKYNNLDEVTVKNSNDSIKVNANNKFKEKVYSNNEIANNLFFTFKKLCLAKPEIIFNKYMDSDYKNKRFTNIKEFNSYFEVNKDEISKINAKEFIVNYYKDNTEYIIKDQYKNVYVFNIFQNQKINVMLDIYTIPTDKFKEAYKEADEVKKVQLDIEKFIQMINRADYNTSYNYLSDGFKNNYFNTRDDFEKFIKNNLFMYNKFEIENYEKKGNSLYVVNVKLSDLTEVDKEYKNINFVIQLENDLDYSVAFNMN